MIRNLVTNLVHALLLQSAAPTRHVALGMAGRESNTGVGAGLENWIEQESKS